MRRARFCPWRSAAPALRGRGSAELGGGAWRRERRVEASHWRWWRSSRSGQQLKGDLAPWARRRPGPAEEEAKRREGGGGGGGGGSPLTSKAGGESIKEEEGEGVELAGRTAPQKREKKPS
ncbi:hypothetical protein U9M48_021657 [Paspalum notatum var. saurae]|uniref:Uncharacterized protein n=1 Tax=Paspalum notatum var. saurae TaxID=547442 RepID=A0AAQ3THX1_PASNO